MVSASFAQQKDSSTFKVDTAKLITFSSFTVQKTYRVNWAKVKTFKDMKKILKAFNFQVWGTNSEAYKQIHQYLIETK